MPNEAQRIQNELTWIMIEAIREDIDAFCRTSECTAGEFADALWHPDQYRHLHSLIQKHFLKQPKKDPVLLASRFMNKIRKQRGWE